MNHKPEGETHRAKALAELIERLGRIAHTRCYSDNLNPSQWAALRFLARANPSARTVTAFARANGTTHGTATQTISALVRKGLVDRSPDPADRRVTRLDLTSSGLALLREDPLNELVEALGQIPDKRARALVIELAELSQKLTAPTPRTGRRKIRDLNGRRGRPPL